MAKNAKYGAAVAFTTTQVTYEGNVVEVTKSGVLIETRDMGKQTSVERFFGKGDIIAHTDAGEGFVTVLENRPVAAYHGLITTDNGSVTVTTEDKRDITFNQVGNIQLRVDYDANEQPSSVYAKMAKRNSDKLGTAMRRMAEKAGSKTKATPKKKKKK
jgi:hypothetical protein